MKLFDNKYRHFWIVAYIPFFLLGFFLLEGRTDIEENLVYIFVDDYIPFCEYFIVPYLLWFPYLLGTVLFFICRVGKSERERSEFYRLAYLLLSGMTISLLIYVIWPSTLQLRPEVYPRENIFTSICAALQGFDTPSNVCPSLHVYTSIVVHASIWASECFRNKLSVRIGSFILMLLICTSTLFTKQHSIVDIFCAFLLFLALSAGYMVSKFYYSRIRKKTAD